MPMTETQKKAPQERAQGVCSTNSVTYRSKAERIAEQYLHFPDELKDKKIWMCADNHKLPKSTQWHDIPKKTGDGILGWSGSVSEPVTWDDFESCVTHAANNRYEHLCMVLMDPYLGIDLDHCYDPETNTFIRPECEQIIRLFEGKTYIEYSRSKTGFHIICKGKKPGAGCKKNDMEMYQAVMIPETGKSDKGRQFNCTGLVYGSCFTIAEMQTEIEEAYRMIGLDERDSRLTAEQTPVTLTMSDEDLLQRINNSRSRIKVKKLMKGDIEDYKGPDGNPDESKADYVLCCEIATFSSDPEQIERIFSQSELAKRDKWQRQDYRQRTIQRAIESTMVPDWCPPDLYPAKKEMQDRIDTLPQMARFKDLTGIEKALLNGLWTDPNAPVLVKALAGQSHKAISESADRIMMVLSHIGYKMAGRQLLDIKALPDMISNIMRLSPLIEDSRSGLPGLPALAAQAVQMTIDILPDPKINELLKRNAKSKEIEPSARNVTVILENDHRIPELRRNLMTGETELDEGPIPWNRGGKTDRLWSQDETSCLHVWLDEEYNFRPKETEINTAVRAVSLKASYHPVREWFKTLPAWDGVNRASTLFVDYLGVEDSPYTRAVTRLFLTAAYQRVHHPGIKMDSMPILIGPQGIGKSTIIRLLACNDDWYSNNLKISDMGSKDAAIALRYSWIFELGEMAGLRVRDDESIRNWLTTTTDKYRPPYGRTEVSYPRQCVLIGTSNERSLLRDTAGNRRYWPLFIPENTPKEKRGWLLDHDTALQIWAEVQEKWSDETTLCLPPELEADAKEMQEAAFDKDPRAGQIEKLLNIPLRDNWTILTRRNKINHIWSMQCYEEDLSDQYTKDHRRDAVSVVEVWDMLNADEDGTNASKSISSRESRELWKIMMALPEWEPALTHHGTPARKDFGPGYGRQKYFKRKGS